LRLDECDSFLPEYKKLKLPSTFELHIGPRTKLGAAMAEFYTLNPNLDWYGLLADDVVPITECWDTKLISAAGSNNISGAQDGRNKGHFYCHPIIGGELVRAVGWFGFPYTTHFHLESPWKYLTKKDKRFGKVLSDVIVKHEHFRYDKSIKDRIYKESQSVKNKDKKIWNAWLNSSEFNEFLENARKVL
jgi:hypothetical protein